MRNRLGAIDDDSLPPDPGRPALAVALRSSSLVLLIVVAGLLAALALFGEAIRLQPAGFLLGCLVTALAVAPGAWMRLARVSEAAERAREEREKARSQYDILANNLAAAIIIRDGAGRLVFCSPYTEVLTGYARRDIYEQGGDFFAGIIHEDDRPIYNRAQKVTAYGEAFQYRTRFFHRTGLQMWAETRTVPILDEHGIVISSLSIMIDVTGTALYQRQVEETNQDLQDFTYMISHDLKGPIATIKGMMHMIHEEGRGALSAECRDALDYIEKATQRIELLVSSVIEYARIAATDSNREPVELSQVMNDIAADVAPQLKPLGASLEIEPGLPAVLGEPVRLYQIFANLVSNALKYRSPDRPPIIKIGIKGAERGRTVIISVADNGIGIPEEKLEAVFRPFIRAHPQHADGAGIGLACVKKMTEKLGGEIRLTSTVDQGTTIELKFLRPPSH